MSIPNPRIGVRCRLRAMAGSLVVGMALLGSNTVTWSAAKPYSPELDSPLHLQSPAGITYDAASHVLYVADFRAGRVLKLTSSGRLLASWNDVGVPAGQLDVGPNQVGVDGAGNVYVDEPALKRIQKFSPAGKVLATWSGVKGYLTMAVDAGGYVYLGGSAGVTPPGLVEKLSPSGKVSWRLSLGASCVAVDTHGTVYVANAASQHQAVPYSQIVKLSSAGKRLSTLHPKEVAAGYMTVGANGNIYARDGITDSVDKVGANGSVVARWRLPVLPLPGPGLAVDLLGYVYVVTTDSIYKLSPEGKIVATWR
jgi:hypothetical protein